MSGRDGCAPEFDVFEAVCGVTGDFGCCGQDAPEHAYTAEYRRRAVPLPDNFVPCTRNPGHLGDHVAGHVDGIVYARWKAQPSKSHGDTFGSAT